MWTSTRLIESNRCNMGKRHSDIYNVTNVCNTDNTILFRLLTSILKRSREQLSRKIVEVSTSVGLPVETATGLTAVKMRDVFMNPSPADAALAELTVEVGNLESVVDSGVSLLNKLGEMIIADADNPAAMRELGTRIKGKSTEFAEAIAKNTPAEEPPLPPAGQQRKP